ncbi:hypothetical protein [Paracoccus broussonetiae]|uniref:Uncharacterized protein n=1 Tax=Paracoccus broussonetiae subsp. drimophilus TaxID=3373869 RepID=A0ABW7LMJ1_9RHOB
MIAAALVAAALAAPPLVDTGRDRAEALIAAATQDLLDGKPLDPGIDVDLRRLDPAGRLRVLIFLRRSGMLDGPGWTADMLLAPADADGAGQ